MAKSGKKGSKVKKSLGASLKLALPKFKKSGNKSPRKKIFPNGVPFIPKYFKESFKELKKVTWPSRRDSLKLFVAVGAFAIVLGTIIGVADYIFEKIMERILL